MPFPLHIINNFKKRYGADWEKRFFAWKNANPTQFSKALATSRKRGDPIIEHANKTKDGRKHTRKVLQRYGFDYRTKQ